MPNDEALKRTRSLDRLRPLGQRRLPAWTALSAVVAAVYVAGAQASRRDPSQIETAPRGEFLQLEWSDAEDRIQGAMTPAHPRAGSPFRVTLDVGTFEGEPFNGAVTMAVSPLDGRPIQERVVQRGERGWTAEFVVPTEGRYELDVGFQTTRHKVARAVFEVRQPPIPRWLGWSVVAAAALLILFLGGRGVWRRGRPPRAPDPI